MCMGYTIFARRGTEQQYQAAAVGRQHASRHRYYITRWCLGFSSAIQFLVSLAMFFLLFHALFASFIGRNFRLSVWNSCCCCCSTILCRYTNGEYTIQQLNTRHVSPSGMHYTLRTYTHSLNSPVLCQRIATAKEKLRKNLKQKPVEIYTQMDSIQPTIYLAYIVANSAFTSESERGLDLSLNTIDHGS